MRTFFNETRKAWAAAATIFGGGITEAAADGAGISGEEWTLTIIAAVVAWIITWAVPNKPSA